MDEIETSKLRIQKNLFFNRKLLLEVMMKKLGLNEIDLTNDCDWVKRKIRDHMIDSCLEDLE